MQDLDTLYASVRLEQAEREAWLNHHDHHAEVTMHRARHHVRPRIASLLVWLARQVTDEPINLPEPVRR